MVARILGLCLVMASMLSASRALADDVPPPPDESTSGSAALPPLPPPAVTEPAPVALSPRPGLVWGGPSFGCAEQPAACADPSRPETPRATWSWYGYQTLLADAATVGLGFTLGGSGEAGGVVATGALYAFGAPAIHLAHGNPLTALASFGARVVSPFAGALGGGLLGASGCGGRLSGAGGCLSMYFGAALGALGGFVAASALDAALFARDRPAPRPWDGKPTLGPRAAVTHEGASLGLGGAF